MVILRQRFTWYSRGFALTPEALLTIRALRSTRETRFSEGSRSARFFNRSMAVGLTVGEAPGLLDLLESTAHSHQADLRSNAAQAYVKRLASLPLHDLRLEPANIANERTNVDTELVNLCYREYSTFTSVHRCSSAVGTAFNDFDVSLGDLINSIPSLEQECRQFIKANSLIQSQRRKAVLLLEHENKLLDILEIPQLMESCVRSGNYQEALDLASHIDLINTKVASGVVKDVVEEVNGILQLMAAQLLGVLREPVKLPVLLKAVNYLRRLQDIDYADLGLVFLSSRLHNYRSCLVEVEQHRGEPIRYLRKYIDLFREHVFDIISQYTTIFPGAVGDQLASFACLCVDDLVDLVHRYMPRIQSDPASMSSILVQLGYCSLSFRRVGLDFSALLEAPFTMAIRASYGEAVASASTLFAEMLTNGIQDATTPSDLLIAHPHLQSILTDEASPPCFSETADPHAPPTVLAFFPPIAQFLNTHMSSLNALRMLAPLQLSTDLLVAQSQSITRASEAVLKYLRQALDTYGPPTSMTRPSSGSSHTRTGSSPRAHLLRRNTETQLSSESLLARRREAKRVCVAFGDAWLHAISFIRNALCEVLEQRMMADDEVMRDISDCIGSWISSHGEVLETVESPDVSGPDPTSSLAMAQPHNGPTDQPPSSGQATEIGDSHTIDPRAANVLMTTPKTADVTLDTPVTDVAALATADRGSATTVANDSIKDSATQEAENTGDQMLLPGIDRQPSPEGAANLNDDLALDEETSAISIVSSPKVPRTVDRTSTGEPGDLPVAAYESIHIDDAYISTVEQSSMGNAATGASLAVPLTGDQHTHAVDIGRATRPESVTNTMHIGETTLAYDSRAGSQSPDTTTPTRPDAATADESPVDKLAQNRDCPTDILPEDRPAPGAQPPAASGDIGLLKTAGGKKKKKKGKK